MRDANEREEQFRKRIQPNINIETPKEVQPTVSTVSSASSLSFHTPAIEQSPTIAPPIEDKPPVISPPSTKPAEIVNVTPKETTQTIIRHTATEETTQADYRPGIKLVPSNVLKSTIQNYMMDHNPLDGSQGKSNQQYSNYSSSIFLLIKMKKHYLRKSTIGIRLFPMDLNLNIKIHSVSLHLHPDNIPLLYISSDFHIQDNAGQLSNQSWFDYDMSPLRVWLEHSIAPLIHVQ
jgi:hypothetical protein